MHVNEILEKLNPALKKEKIVHFSLQTDIWILPVKIKVTYPFMP